MALLRRLRVALFVLLVSGLPVCGGCDGTDTVVDSGVDAGTTIVDEDGGSDAGPPPYVVPTPEELVLTPMTAPVDVADGAIFTSFEYGPGESQVIDAFYLPDAAAPTAAVIFIHGGGFTGGSRTAAYSGGRATELQSIVDAGVAYFSIGYTLLSPGTETEGVIKSLRDARRALQLIRYYAEPLNIDPDRVGLMGTSAGAGTSLWLAFHDDMADAGSADPVARESTRVQVAAVLATQATYELLRWPTDVFSPTYPLTVQELLGQPALAAQVATFYGVSLVLVSQPAMLEEILRTPEYVAYREDLDMLALMSSDDAPFFVRNESPDRAPGESGFDILHHPLHAAALADRATEVGLEAMVEAPALSLGGDADSTQFLLGHLAP